MGFLECMDWMKWMASHLNLFELHSLQLRTESELLFLFFKEDNSTLLCWNILNFFGVLNGKLCGMNGGIGFVIAGEYSWPKWMSIPGMSD